MQISVKNLMRNTAISYYIHKKTEGLHGIGCYHSPKRFTHLCRALCGDAILVYRFGAPIWPPEINKNIWSTGSTGTGGKPSTSNRTPAGIETIQRFGQKHSARPAN